MAAMSVVAWVASEPRKQVPLDLVFGSLRRVDVSVFWEVQAAVLMSAAETPLHSTPERSENHSGSAGPGATRRSLPQVAVC